MEADVVIQLVSTLGFPIVCCGALFWKMVKEEADHKEETKQFTNALQENTNVITELITMLRKED